MLLLFNNNNYVISLRVVFFTFCSPCKAAISSGIDWLREVLRCRFFVSPQELFFYFCTHPNDRHASGLQMIGGDAPLMHFNVRQPCSR